MKGFILGSPHETHYLYIMEHMIRVT